MSQRMVRINRLLQTTLGELLPARVRDHRVQAADLVVVCDVQTSADLAQARVFVEIEGRSDQVRRDALEALHGARGFLRRELGRRVRLRRIPELQFVCREGGEQVDRIARILKDLQVERARPREISLAELARVVQDCRRVLITTHPAPDGDAIGSTVALYLALRDMGKQVTLYNPDPLPERFCFLEGADAFVDRLPEQGVELTLLLDCSDSRMFPQGVPSPEWRGQVIVIDHHKTVGELGDAIYRDSTAASTGVLVYRLLQALEAPLELAVAESLYCSILSDTGSFRYGNTNPECMRVSAELLEHGVDSWHIASNIYESQPPNQLALLSAVLKTLQLSGDGRAAALLVSQEMLQETGCHIDMVDGFINYARALRGVEVGILLRWQPPGLRVSLRSRGNVDVSEIATSFGGGGHYNAAGFTVSDSPELLLPRLFDEVSRRCGSAVE